MTDITENRKKDHLDLAHLCQTPDGEDSRFNYEPLLSAHPAEDYDLSTSFLGKILKAPLWISSITGGGVDGKKINQRLARGAKQFGIGMGVGSFRPLLENEKKYRDDFDLRELIGDELPLYGNLGISQVENILAENELNKTEELIKRYRYDGLIVHVNPIQEWLQPEGDRFKRPPIETITRLVDMASFPIIVKEVGQGMGPASLEALMRLPLAAIEFGARGGTNFSLIEEKRDIESEKSPLSSVGHKAYEMVKIATKLSDSLKNQALCQEYIISGGINSSLDGYYLAAILKKRAVIGFAYKFAMAANISYEQLEKVLRNEIELLKMANCYLTLKQEI